MLDSVICAGAWTQSLFYINMYMYSNNVAYNSPTEASDYEIWKSLRDQLLFSFQFIEKPAKWNCGKVTNTSILSTTSCVQRLNLHTSHVAYLAGAYHNLHSTK